MASGSKSHGCGSGDRGSCRACTEAPSVNNALVAPLLNPVFEAMTATEIIAHLNHSRRTSDFADAALVFAARERRLNEAEALIHMSNERVERLKGEIREHEYKAKAQIYQAIKMEMGLRAEIRALQLRANDIEAHARHGSGISGCSLTQQASHGLSSIKESYGDELDHKVSEDVLKGRVIEGSKVPNEGAQGKDVAASHHRHWQGEQPARATKKARGQEGPSFYKLVFDALKEKQELLLKREKEKAAKEAAATASKQLGCRCWWSDRPE